MSITILRDEDIFVKNRAEFAFLFSYNILFVCVFSENIYQVYILVIGAYVFDLSTEGVVQGQL